MAASRLSAATSARSSPVGQSANGPCDAWIANYGSGTVTPIGTATRRPGRAIKAGAAPVALAITPNGRTVHVVSEGSSTGTPIAIATNRPGSPITVGAGPRAIVMIPGGRIAYV
jgi:DNA-binding beta-propeller fold protein YncE